MATNKTLQYLDLRQNELDPAGLMALAKTCQHNKALVSVLIDNPAPEESVCVCVFVCVSLSHSTRVHTKR